MLINDIHLTQLNAPKQTIKARVELLRGSTLERVCNCGDILSEMSIERTGEGKFFGFGICQKLNVSLIDVNRDIIVTPEHTLEAVFGVDADYIYPFPRFYVQDIERDETNNMIKLTAYDILFQAEKYKVSDLGLQAPYTIRAVTAACANILGVPLVYINVDPVTFDVNFPEGANFDGTESVRYALNAISEVTQTIYYMNNKWELTFHRLDKDAALVKTIGRDEYIELFNQEKRTITNIAHVTELGDNSSTVGDDTGVTQFVRDNPFWELREDIGDLLNQAQRNIAGLSIHQFESLWSGNYLIEIGDRIGFTTENGKTLSTFLLDDTITFDGVLMETTRWHYDENEGETYTNPVTIGDSMNQTFARVDKVNKQIELVASDVTENISKIASLILTTDEIKAEVSRVEKEGDQAIATLTLTADEIKAEVSRIEKEGDQAIADLTLTADEIKAEVQRIESEGDQAIADLTLTADEIKAEVQRIESETDQAIADLSIQADNISASVTTVETQLNDTADSLTENITTLTKEVEAKMTSDQVNLIIQQTLEDGVNSVTTSTGYTFNEEGMTVSKSDSEMSTQITEDGMVIRHNDDAMLTADHTGVNAMNLHATTYLMVGGRSRFENYESNRTGCFWIGGIS